MRGEVNMAVHIYVPKGGRISSDEIKRQMKAIEEGKIGYKITELLMSGDPVKKANIDNETLKLLQKHLGEYVLVKDRDNCVRVLRCS